MYAILIVFYSVILLNQKQIKGSITPIPSADSLQAGATASWGPFTKKSLNTSLRYNWYYRKRLLERIHTLHDILSEVLKTVEDAIPVFESKKEEVVQDIDHFKIEFEENIKKQNIEYSEIGLQNYANDQFKILFDQLNDKLNQTELLLTEEQKIYYVDKLKLLDAQIKNIRSQISNFFININNFFENSYHVFDNSFNQLKEYVEAIKHYENQAWNNYQQLNELISDDQARQLLHETDLMLKNAQNKKNFIYTGFVGYVNALIQSILAIENSLKNELKNILSEISNIQNNVKTVHQEMFALLAEEEQKKEKEAHEEALRMKNELQKKEELLRLANRKWWEKAQDYINETWKSFTFNIKNIYQKLSFSVSFKKIWDDYILVPVQKIWNKDKIDISDKKIISSKVEQDISSDLISNGLEASQPNLKKNDINSDHSSDVNFSESSKLDLLKTPTSGITYTARPSMPKTNEQPISEPIIQIPQSMTTGSLINAPMQSYQAPYIPMVSDNTLTSTENLIPTANRLFIQTPMNESVSPQQVYAQQSTDTGGSTTQGEANLFPTGADLANALTPSDSGESTDSHARGVIHEKQQHHKRR